MPGKWGGVRRVRPPRSANDIICIINKKTFQYDEYRPLQYKG